MLTTNSVLVKEKLFRSMGDKFKRRVPTAAVAKRVEIDVARVFQNVCNSIAIHKPFWLID